MKRYIDVKGQSLRVSLRVKRSGNREEVKKPRTTPMVRFGIYMKKAKPNSKWWNIFRRRVRKIEITTETARTVKIRRFTSSVVRPCAHCQADTIFSSPNEAIAVFQTDMEDLDYLIRTGRVHIVENVNAELQVCFSSLRKQLESISGNNDSANQKLPGKNE